MTTPHTKDLGIAIRDALDLLDEIETFDWSEEDKGDAGGPYDCPRIGGVFIRDVDASDADNLRVTLGTATFRVRITREA